MNFIERKCIFSKSNWFGLHLVSFFVIAILVLSLGHKFHSSLFPK